MRFSMMITALCAVLLLAACSRPQEDAMKAPLDKMRAMVTQSALMAAQAACSDPATRSELIDGAVTMLRRATSGPEMASLHKMMGGEMNMDEAGRMPMKGGKQPDSPQSAMHMAVHTASGNVFDLLDTLSQPPGLSCEDLRPVSLAAGAAMLRQQQGQGEDEATRKLERDMGVASANLDAAVPASMNEDTAEAIRTVALALQKI